MYSRVSASPLGSWAAALLKAETCAWERRNVVFLRQYAVARGGQLVSPRGGAKVIEVGSTRDFAANTLVIISFMNFTCARSRRQRQRTTIEQSTCIPVQMERPCSTIQLFRDVGRFRTGAAACRLLEVQQRCWGPLSTTERVLQLKEQGSTKNAFENDQWNRSSGARRLLAPAADDIAIVANITNLSNNDTDRQWVQGIEENLGVDGGQQVAPKSQSLNAQLHPSAQTGAELLKW
jgi:hypothetical protein